MPDYLPFLVFGAVVAVILTVSTYNRFIKYINMIEEAWSTIDVALKRRYNLIPNLIETIKGYSRHEAGVLESVTGQRTAQESPAGRGRDESAISRSLSSVLAVAEAYPELKASHNFLELQKNLNQIEEDIQKARQAYNRSVRRLNTLVQQFPSNIIARIFRFKRREYFTLELATQRDLPDVEF